jgi:hypothetical protein
VASGFGEVFPEEKSACFSDKEVWQEDKEVLGEPAFS